MLYIIPDYYKEFVCIADQCEDTCCTGWQIVIDKKSLKKYRRVKGGFRKRLRVRFTGAKGFLNKLLIKDVRF